MVFIIFDNYIPAKVHKKLLEKIEREYGVEIKLMRKDGNLVADVYKDEQILLDEYKINSLKNFINMELFDELARFQGVLYK